MRSGVAERARRVKLLTLSILTAVWAGGCGHRGPSGRAAALPPASHVCRPLRSERPATERCETPSGRVWLQSSETVLEDMPDFDSIQSHVVLDALHSYVLSEAVARHGARLLSFVPYEDLNGRCTRAQRFEVAWAGPDGGFAGIIVAASVAPRSGTVAILTCAGRKEEIAAACTPLLRARLASLTCGATRGGRRQQWEEASGASMLTFSRSSKWEEGSGASMLTFSRSSRPSVWSRPTRSAPMSRRS
jgi:hypothetical protein